MSSRGTVSARDARRGRPPQSGDERVGEVGRAPWRASSHSGHRSTWPATARESEPGGAPTTKPSSSGLPGQPVASMGEPSTGRHDLQNVGVLHNAAPSPRRRDSIIWDAGALDHRRPSTGRRCMNHSRPAESPARQGRRPPPRRPRACWSGVKADDAEAWDRLVGLYAPLVYRWCRRWDLPEQEIADVFQDVFQAVATHIAATSAGRGGRHISRLAPDDHPEQGARTISGGSGASRAAPAGPRPSSGSHRLPDEHPDGDESDDGPADRSLFGSALDLIRGEFEERTWRAFWLTAVEGRTAVDVALELAMSPGAVRVAKSRVLRRLREELGDIPQRGPGNA